MVIYMSQEIQKNKEETNSAIVNIDGWLEQREEFLEKVSSKMIEKKDYHVIQGKKSLAKGGAEKISSIFGWVAKFERDTETLEMLGKDHTGTLAYICNLYKGDQVIGQGRGARSVAADEGDVNKSIKMAQKSAYVDAVLRASGLSDLFTQDIEDMPQFKRPAAKKPTSNIPPNTPDGAPFPNDMPSTGPARRQITAAQKNKISELAKQLNATDEVIQGLTGIVYSDIDELDTKQGSDIIKNLIDAVAVEKGL